MVNTGFYLTLLVGPVVPVPVPRAVLDALTSVSVTHDTESRSGFELQFTISTASPLHTIFLLTSTSAPLLRVMIIMTMNGVPSVLMDGVMTSHRVSGGKAGKATLTIMGSDLTAVMDVQDFSGIPYPAMPSEARVALIVAKYAMFGIIPIVIPGLFADVPIPVDRIPIHEGTDLEYVRSLADDIGYVFYIDPGPVPGTNYAYWGPEIKVGIPQPALNVDMDAYTNVDSLDFTFNTDDGDLPIVLIQNRESRVTIPIPIPSINPLQPPLGLFSAPIVRFSMTKDTAKSSAMGAIAEGIAAAARSSDAVSASGSLNVVRYGRLLKARGLVGVRGAGLAFDGLYFVKKVTSTIARGEFKQSFELSRNGIVSITPVVPA